MFLAFSAFLYPFRQGGIFYHRTQRFKVTSKLQKWHWSSALGERKDVRDGSQGMNSRWAGERFPVWRQKHWPGGLRQAGAPAVGHPQWEVAAFRRKILLLLGGVGWPDCNWQSGARAKRSPWILSTVWSAPWVEGKLPCQLPNRTLQLPPSPKCARPEDRTWSPFETAMLPNAQQKLWRNSISSRKGMEEKKWRSTIYRLQLETGQHSQTLKEIMLCLREVCDTYT